MELALQGKPALAGFFVASAGTGTDSGEVIELFVERETAEQALRDVLTDEPREAGPTVVEISGHSLRAELTRASPGSARPHRDHMGKAFGDLYGRSGDYTETTAAARIDLS